MEFYKFFLVEVVYIFQELAERKVNPKSRVSQQIPVHTLNQIVQLLKSSTWLNDIDKPNIPGRLDFSKLNLFSFKPLDYQMGFLEYYDKIPTRYRLNGALLSAAAGSGKSFTSIACLECAGAERIIVACPKIAIQKVWHDDPNRFYKVPPKIHSSLSTGPFDPDTKLFIYHYEALDRAIEEHRKDFGKYNYKLVLDECVSPDTEVLTTKGFKKITEVSTTDLILQHHRDGSVEWVNPSRVVKKPTREAILYQGNGWKQLVTPNHRMIYMDKTYRMQEAVAQYFKLHQHIGHRIITGGQCKDLERLEWDCFSISDQIQLRKHLTKRMTEVITNKDKTTLYKFYKPMTFYCVTVPSGMFYIRYNGKISVTGNCHNLNDIKAQRTQKWLELVKLSGATDVIHMSGTPLKAMGYECIPLLRVVDPQHFHAKAEEAFKKIYGVQGQRGLDILKHRLGLMSYTVEKAQIGLAPPEITTLGIKIPNGKDFTLTAVKIAMEKYIEERVKYYKSREKEDVDFYQSCLKYHESQLGFRQREDFKRYLNAVKVIQNCGGRYGDIPEEMSYAKQYEIRSIVPTLDPRDAKEFKNICPIIKYLPLKIQGECLGNVVGRMRIDAHRAMCQHIPFGDICESTKKKTVVFTSFVEVLEDSYRACQQQGLDPILVYGKTSKDIAPIVTKFGQDGKINPLIATYSSLSTAVPLTMADTMIMVNAPFRAYIQEQAISRIHRLNQDSQTRVIQCYLDTGEESNISSRSLDIMKWSQQQVEAMTGVKSPYTIEDNGDGSVSVSTEGWDESLDYSISVETVYDNNTEHHPSPKLISSSVLSDW